MLTKGGFSENEADSRGYTTAHMSESVVAVVTPS